MRKPLKEVSLTHTTSGAWTFRERQLFTRWLCGDEGPGPPVFGDGRSGRDRAGEGREFGYRGPHEVVWRGGAGRQAYRDGATAGKPAAAGNLRFGANRTVSDLVDGDEAVGVGDVE